MGLLDRLGQTGPREYDADDRAVPSSPKPERKFNFWVKRSQDFGGNVQGVCTDVRVDRAGTLVVLGPEIRRFAPGTWLECKTSRAWEECGGE